MPCLKQVCLVVKLGSQVMGSAHGSSAQAASGKTVTLTKKISIYLNVFMYFIFVLLLSYVFFSIIKTDTEL
jgi:hypothetical protein